MICPGVFQQGLQQIVVFRKGQQKAVRRGILQGLVQQLPGLRPLTQLLIGCRRLDL